MLLSGKRHEMSAGISFPIGKNACLNADIGGFQSFFSAVGMLTKDGLAAAKTGV